MNLSGKVVLFADDELFAMRPTREALEVRGAVVVKVTDGTEVLEYLRSHKTEPPDVVILDVMMASGQDITTDDEGRSTGVEVYRRIRQGSAKLPIVVSTIVTDDKILEQFSGDARTSIVKKPYEIEELLRCIAKVC